MSKHTEKGKIFIGGRNFGGENVGGQDITKGITTNKNNKKTKKDDSDTKKGKQTFRSKFVYGGSEGVDESVKKENYEDPRKHKLRNQFDYLADKYYGGSKEDFAKTSQGQVLLGYLAGVSADRGGGRGGDIQALQAGAPDLFQRTQMNLPNITVDPSFNRSITPFDIRNLSAQAVKDNLRKAGITDTNAFKRFNEALLVAAPDAYAEARPLLSGIGIGNLLERLIPAYISGPITGLLPERATGGLTPDEYLNQELFANLPMDQRVDSGGVNEVAQSIINNQMQEEEEGEGEFDITQFDPNSFIQGFGFPFVDPSLFNLDGTGITGLQI